MSSYERAFNTKSALFTECQNSIPSSRYWRLNTVEYGGNRTFPNRNLYYKNIAKNDPNNEFLEPKMVLDFIFDGFHVSLWFASCKTTKNLVLTPFWEILSKKGQFLPKMGPETLNCDIWYFTFFNRSQEPNDLETWNLAKL